MDLQRERTFMDIKSRTEKILLKFINRSLSTASLLLLARSLPTPSLFRSNLKKKLIEIFIEAIHIKTSKYKH